MSGEQERPEAGAAAASGTAEDATLSVELRALYEQFARADTMGSGRPSGTLSWRTTAVARSGWALTPSRRARPWSSATSAGASGRSSTCPA